MISAMGRKQRKIIMDAFVANSKAADPSGQAFWYLYPFFAGPTPNGEMQLTDFTIQSSPGSPLTNGALQSDDSAFVRGLNSNGEEILQYPGGYSDTVSAGSASLGMSITGYVAARSDGLQLNAAVAVQFDEPIPLQYDGQIVEFGIEFALANEVGGVGE